MQDLALPHSHTLRIYNQIRDEILTGIRTPESRLKVEELKRSLDVGASPIREALSLLTSDRLVERLDQRGFRVATLSASHFAEVMELRCMLEARALQASIECGGANWRSRVREAHDAMTCSDVDMPSFEARHKAFHMSLLSAHDAPVLLSICDQLYDQNVRYRYVAQSNESYAARDVRDEHAEILDATVKGEADYAVSLLHVHYRRTGHYLLSLLQDL